MDTTMGLFASEKSPLRLKDDRRGYVDGPKWHALCVVATQRLNLELLGE
jgi:hypothetical protein